MSLKTNREIFILWQLLNLEPKSKHFILKKFENPIETFWGQGKVYSKSELAKRIGKSGDVFVILNRFEEMGILKEVNGFKDGKEKIGYTIDIDIIDTIYKDSIYPKLQKRINELKPLFS